MPVYDVRCNTCGRESALMYKSIAAYAAAVEDGAVQCPHCHSTALTRLIRSVRLAGATPIDYTGMSAEQMKSVLESGQASDVNAMVKQVTGTATKPASG